MQLPQHSEGLGFFSLPSLSLPAINWGALASTVATGAAQLAVVKAKADADRAAAQAQQAAQAAQAAQQAQQQQALMMGHPAAYAPAGVQYRHTLPRVSSQGVPPWVPTAALAVAGVAVLFLVTRRI